MAYPLICYYLDRIRILLIHRNMYLAAQLHEDGWSNRVGDKILRNGPLRIPALTIRSGQGDAVLRIGHFLLLLSDCEDIDCVLRSTGM